MMSKWPRFHWGSVRNTGNTASEKLLAATAPEHQDPRNASPLPPKHPLHSFKCPLLQDFESVHLLLWKMI